jgi:cholesterol transport system auxiliary component
MKRTSALTGVLLAAFSLTLAGCNLVPERKSTALYNLPAQALEPAAPGVDTTLRLSTPRASGLLEGSRIVVEPQPNQLRVYQGVRWSDSMPQLVRDRLVDAFQDDGRIPRLAHAESTVSAEVELLSDLRTFHSVYNDALPEAVVRLDVRLVETRSQRLIASQRFIQRHQAESEAIPDVVTAFGAATDRLVGELVDWTVTQLGNR